MTLAEMIAHRAKLIADARKLQTVADDAKRDMTPEEEGQFDALFTDADTTRDEIAATERRNDRRSQLDAAEAALEGPAGRRSNEDAPTAPPAGDGPENRNADHLRSLPDYLRDEAILADMPPEARSRVQALTAADYDAGFRHYLRTGSRGRMPSESRAWSAGSDVDGGFLLAPLQMSTQIIAGLQDEVTMRRLTRNQFPVLASESLGVVTVESDPSDPDWTEEVPASAMTADTSAKLGRREFKPVGVSKLLKISRKLVRMSPNAVAVIMDRLRYKFATVEENAFLNGTGVKQPLGVFAVSDNGIPSSRDVSTDNTTTLIKPDGLLEAFYSLKPQYQRNATWLMHRHGIKLIRKAKEDSTGQYLWQPGIRAGEPDTVLGRPIEQSEYAPASASYTTGTRVGIVGDFNYYWIADALSLEIQILTELYAATNQVGYIGRKETDGMPVMAEAFAGIKLA